MQSGNGIDLAAIYHLLTEVAEKVASHDRRFEQIDRRFEQIDRKIDDVAAGLSELRSTLYQYHAAVESGAYEYHGAGGARYL